jgi:predicted membrane protein
MIAAMSLPTVAVIVVKGPGVDDIYAVLGAVVASILAVMESLQKRRDYFHAVSMFLGSGFVGAFAPGPVYHLLSHLKWIPADAAMFGLWQTWAIAGFIFGLNGWYFIHKTSDRLRDFIDRFKK